MSTHAWLTAAALVSMLRFVGIAAFGSVPALLVLAQCTHAVTFAAQHGSCIAVLNRHFLGRLRGRGQALYTVLGLRRVRRDRHSPAGGALEPAPAV